MNLPKILFRFHGLSGEELQGRDLITRRVKSLSLSISVGGRHFGFFGSRLVYLDRYIIQVKVVGLFSVSILPQSGVKPVVISHSSSIRVCPVFVLNHPLSPTGHPPLIGIVLHTVTVYTKINRRGAYNLLRIAAGEKWTALRTRYGLFKYKASILYTSVIPI
jgi:hypothetical protein